VSRTTADAIREAALRILETEGPEAVSLRRVATAVGITPMAIYHHFPSREALLHDVCDAEFERHAALLVADQQQAGGSIQARLTRNLDTFLDFALQRPHVYDFVFSQPRTGARRYPEDFKARRSPTANVLADLISEGMRTGLFRKGDVWEATLLIKASPTTAHIPVIALTAHALSSDRAKSVEVGCADFDTKPVDLPRLLGKIRACLPQAA